MRTAGSWPVRAHAAILAALLLPAIGLAAGSWAQNRPPEASPGPETNRAADNSPAAAARARANDDMDRLRREIRLLAELHEAQRALENWNRLRVEAGEPAAQLDPALCGALSEWCRALPGTFGRGRKGDAP